MKKNALLSQIFARMLHFYHQKFCPDFALVPIPPRPGKIASEGWDQIESVAQFLEGDEGEKAHRILMRTQKIQQKKLSKADRLASKSRYALKKNAKVPERILLFDDIKTTGATLEDAATALKCAGASEVRAFTVFCA